MKKIRIGKTQMLYLAVRIAVTLLCTFNLVAFFMDKDDSQKSRDLFNFIQSALMLACSFVPNFIEKAGKLTVPNVMNVIFIVFCFSHFVIGEIGGLFAKSRIFDSVLHTISGSMVAILGYSVIRLLNNSNKGYLKLSPIFVSMFVICFSITTGVIWEIIEYMADTFTCSNMQRYSDSVTRVDFTGQRALFDTMKDLILDFVGAAAMATTIYIDLRKNDKPTKIKWFIERKQKLASKKSKQTHD